MDAFGLTAAQIDDAGAHWTAREILQQPRMWKEIDDLIAGRDCASCRIPHPLLELPDMRIVLTGAGTSAHIGNVLRPRWRAHSRAASMPSRPLIWWPVPQSYLSRVRPTLLVSFGARATARKASLPSNGRRFLAHCSHLIFTCDSDGALYQARNGRAPTRTWCCLPEACNDRSFAMTSSFTGMLLAAGFGAATAVAGGSARMAPLASLAAQVLPGSLDSAPGSRRRAISRASFIWA